jgi:ketosteroid isomerase-like protein
VSANLDLVRSILAHWERGDYTSVEWAHPDIEYVFADGPSPGSWTGLAAMEEGARHFLRGWEEICTLADEYRELDDECVLVLVHHRGRGKTSGLEIGQIDRGTALLFQLRDGKVTKHVVYFDRDRALADLGLEA